MFILKAILILFLVGFGIFLILAIGLFTKLNNVRKQFQNNQRPNNRDVNGQAVTDTRSPEEANRKIVADDEGEYVDYEDV